MSRSEAKATTLFTPREGDEDHARRSRNAEARLVPLGLEHRVEGAGEVRRRHEDGLDDDPVTPPEEGLVEDLDHRDRPGEHVGAPPEEEGVAVRVLHDLEVLAVEGFEEPAPHLRPPDDREGHQLEDGAVGQGHLGEGAPAHEEGHVARRRLLARGEGEDAFLGLLDVDPVLAEHPAGGREELAGGEGAR